MSLPGQEGPANCGVSLVHLMSKKIVGRIPKGVVPSSGVEVEAAAAVALAINAGTGVLFDGIVAYDAQLSFLKHVQHNGFALQELVTSFDGIAAHELSVEGGDSYRHF